MTTWLGKSCSFGLPRVLFVNCCQYMYLVVSLLVLRAGCGIWLYQFLIIAYLFTELQIYNITLHRRLLNIFYKDHMTNEEVRNRIQNATGVLDDLLTMAKKRKLRWYGHISRSSSWYDLYTIGHKHHTERHGASPILAWCKQIICISKSLTCPDQNI